MLRPPGSGSVLAAQEAHELGRAVGAVPGSVTSTSSVGTHRLLREGVASLVTSAADLARCSITVHGWRMHVASGAKPVAFAVHHARSRRTPLTIAPPGVA